MSGMHFKGCHCRECALEMEQEMKKALVARIRDLEAQLATSKAARNGLEAALELAESRAAPRDAALEEAARVADTLRESSTESDHAFMWIVARDIRALRSQPAAGLRGRTFRPRREETMTDFETVTISAAELRDAAPVTISEFWAEVMAHEEAAIATAVRLLSHMCFRRVSHKRGHYRNLRRRRRKAARP